MESLKTAKKRYLHTKKLFLTLDIQTNTFSMNFTIDNFFLDPKRRM